MRAAGLWATLALVAALLVSLVVGLGGNGEARPRPGEAPIDVASTDRVRVEVLNAGGVSGVARRATEQLRAAGFDVVYYGNASGYSPDSSLVLDRLGEPEAARRVARALGVETVRSAPDTALYLDVTVVLGRDWPAGAAPDTTREAGR